MKFDREKAAKVLFVIFALALLIPVLFWAGGFFFMTIYGLPTAECRPWTILQYWTMYGQSSNKRLALITNLCLFAPFVLLVAAGIAAYIQSKKRALHGAARFATFSEVSKAGLISPKGGFDKTILVGKYKDHYLSYGGYQFVLLAAPTRSGKGVGIVVPNCLNYSDSLVVLDIKGENFDITSGYRAACGQEVYLFSPYDENGQTHRYNPLSYISEDPAERLGDIDAIGQALYSGGGDNDKFWSENAKDFFRGLCLFVLETPDIPHTLGEILRQASGKGKPVKDHLQGKLKEAQDSGHPYSSGCVDSLNRVLSNSENTLAGIVATFNTALLSFQNPRVDMATSDNDFDLREVRRKKMSIYFKIEPTKLKDARVLINLFFDQLLNLNTRKLPAQDKTLKYQCLVLLDEMTSIGTVNMIKQAVSYMAGYNMRLLTIIQNKSQLEDVYGKAGAVTLLSNHALMIMYSPSPATQSDANEYSEMLGYQTVKSKSVSHGKGSNSTSESDQRRALMLPQEIRELGQDREIVTLENTKPILCKKIRYYLDPAFTKRANWERPEIPKNDVGIFVAKMEERIRVGNASEAMEAADNGSLVTGGASLPKDMARRPDSSWGSEEIEAFLHNEIESVQKNSLSLTKLKDAKASDFEDGGAALAAMNEAAGEDSSEEEPVVPSEEESLDTVVFSESDEDEDEENQAATTGESSDEAELIELLQKSTSEKPSDDNQTAASTKETVEGEEDSVKVVEMKANVEDWPKAKVDAFLDDLVDTIRKNLTDSGRGSKPESTVEESSQKKESGNNAGAVAAEETLSSRPTAETTRQPPKTQNIDAYRKVRQTSKAYRKAVGRALRPKTSS